MTEEGSISAIVDLKGEDYKILKEVYVSRSRRLQNPSTDAHVISDDHVTGSHVTVPVVLDSEKVEVTFTAKRRAGRKVTVSSTVIRVKRNVSFSPEKSGGVFFTKHGDELRIIAERTGSGKASTIGYALQLIFGIRVDPGQIEATAEFIKGQYEEALVEGMTALKIRDPKSDTPKTPRATPKIEISLKSPNEKNLEGLGELMELNELTGKNFFPNCHVVERKLMESTEIDDWTWICAWLKLFYRFKIFENSLEVPDFFLTAENRTSLLAAVEFSGKSKAVLKATQKVRTVLKKYYEQGRTERPKIFDVTDWSIFVFKGTVDFGDSHLDTKFNETKEELGKGHILEKKIKKEKVCDWVTAGGCQYVSLFKIFGNSGIFLIS
jgi:hypothetical protein